MGTAAAGRRKRRRRAAAVRWWHGRGGAARRPASACDRRGGAAGPPWPSRSRRRPVGWRTAPAAAAGAADDDSRGARRPGEHTRGRWGGGRGNRLHRAREGERRLHSGRRRGGVCRGKRGRRHAVGVGQAASTPPRPRPPETVQYCMPGRGGGAGGGGGWRPSRADAGETAPAGVVPGGGGGRGNGGRWAWWWGVCTVEGVLSAEADDALLASGPRWPLGGGGWRGQDTHDAARIDDDGAQRRRTAGVGARASAAALRAPYG